MSSYKDTNIKRELIMKHYLEPKNKKSIPKDWKQDHFFSPVCVDKMNLGLKIEEDLIKDVAFEGEGCAVFLASVDIALELIKGKNIIQVKKIMANYNHMINQLGDYDEKLLSKLMIFSNVKTHLNRVTCAMMIYTGLSKLI